MKVLTCLRIQSHLHYYRQNGAVLGGVHALGLDGLDQSSPDPCHDSNQARRCPSTGGRLDASSAAPTVRFMYAALLIAIKRAGKLARWLSCSSHCCLILDALPSMIGCRHGWLSMQYIPPSYSAFALTERIPMRPGQPAGLIRAQRRSNVL